MSVVMVPRVVRPIASAPEAGPPAAVASPALPRREAASGRSLCARGGQCPSSRSSHAWRPPQCFRSAGGGSMARPRPCGPSSRNDRSGRWRRTHPVGDEGDAAVMRHTVESPTYVTADASRSRLDLAFKAGALELGFDLAETIQAANSLEKMLAHQLAATHNAAMKMTAQLNDCTDRMAALPAWWRRRPRARKRSGDPSRRCYRSNEWVTSKDAGSVSLRSMNQVRFWHVHSGDCLIAAPRLGHGVHDGAPRAAHLHGNRSRVMSMSSLLIGTTTNARPSRRVVEGRGH